MDELGPNGGDTTWIDLVNPPGDVVERLGERFGFHPLAVEDVRKRSQRPKVDSYDDHLLVVVYAIEPIVDRPRPSLKEVAIFVTSDVVITIHRDAVPEIDDAAVRWAAHHQERSRPTSTMLLYTIADTIVDGYFPYLDEIGDRIEDLEIAMFDDASPETLEEVFRMKRLLLEVRRVVAPTRDVFNTFIRRESPLLGEHSVAYFMDVYDHVIRVTEAIDADREILSSVIDVHLTLVSNNLNQTVRTLTSASIVLMTLALIAGIYGMNFQHMPELAWRYGYEFALGLMAVIGGGLVLWFKRTGWW